MDVIERFLKYVSFDTQSDENSQTQPTSEKQKVLGAYLAQELKEMGAKDAHLDEYGYVYGWLPATPGHEEEPCLGLIAQTRKSFPDMNDLQCSVAAKCVPSNR